MTSLHALLRLGLAAAAVSTGLIACLGAAPEPPAAPASVETRAIELAPGIELTPRELRLSVGGHEPFSLAVDAVAGLTPSGMPVVTPGGAAWSSPTADVWYRLSPEDVEQGFTVRGPPSPQVTVALSSNYQVRVTSPRRVLFTRGESRIHYADLAAFDATGRALPARFEPIGAQGFQIVVDTKHASFPVTIDPIVFAESQLLKPTELDNGNAFGRSLALDGDTLLVGAPEVPLGGTVFVYERMGGLWSPSGELLPAEALFNDAFGYAVAIDGTRAAVGASEYDGLGLASGGAWVFERGPTGWDDGTQLGLSSFPAGASAGDVVAVAGNTVIIGAPTELIAGVGFGAGAVYVFRDEGSGWTQEARLVAPSPTSSNEGFGTAVAMVGDTLFVAAPKTDVGSILDAGVVHRFTRSGSTWNYEEAFPASTPIDNGDFGRAVAFDGTALLVYHHRGILAPPEVEVRTALAGSWSVVDGTLQQPNPTLGNFGAEVAVDGTRAVAGYSFASSEVGRAFVFERGVSWQLFQTVDNPAPDVGDDFGSAVAVAGDTVVVGAKADATGGTARVYTLVGETCSSGTECESGACVAGYCCNMPCDGGCGRCDGAGTEGVCEPLGVGAAGECGSFLCGAGTACPTFCIEDEQCAAGNFCDGGSCEPLLALGQSCGNDDECAGGACADGVCCDRACDGACEFCAEPAMAGTCVPVTGAPRSAGASCPTDGCVDGFVNQGWTCDGTSPGCVEVNPEACAPYRCDGDACGASCEDDTQCTSNAECQAPTCVPRDPICTGSVLSTPAGETIDCAPFRCVDGASQCPSGCQSSADCVQGFSCSSDGACVDLSGLAVQDVSCSCTAVGRGGRGLHGLHGLAAVALAWGLAFARRRRASGSGEPA